MPDPSGSGASAETPGSTVRTGPADPIRGASRRGARMTVGHGRRGAALDLRGIHHGVPGLELLEDGVERRLVVHEYLLTGTNRGSDRHWPACRRYLSSLNWATQILKDFSYTI